MEKRMNCVLHKGFVLSNVFKNNKKKALNNMKAMRQQWGKEHRRQLEYSLAYRLPKLKNTK